ncbi:MAG: very short patch repair endonuclease [bacterium]
MTDRVTPEIRSRIMSRIRSRNTKPELFVFRELHRCGINFCRHYRAAHGTPDLAQPGRRIAIFIDGSFWHGYRYPSWRHKLPSQFWRDKIERNRSRDRRNFARLRRQGWLVMRVWEHQLKREPEACINRLVTVLRCRPHATVVHRRRHTIQLSRNDR